MNEKISKFTKKQLDKLVKQYMHVWSINWKQQTHDDTVTVTQTLPEKRLVCHRISLRWSRQLRMILKKSYISQAYIKKRRTDRRAGTAKLFYLQH